MSDDFLSQYQAGLERYKAKVKTMPAQEEEALLDELDRLWDNLTDEQREPFRGRP